MQQEQYVPIPDTDNPFPPQGWSHPGAFENPDTMPNPALRRGRWALPLLATLATVVVIVGVAIMAL